MGNACCKNYSEVPELSHAPEQFIPPNYASPRVSLLHSQPEKIFSLEDTQPNNITNAKCLTTTQQPNNQDVPFPNVAVKSETIPQIENHMVLDTLTKFGKYQPLVTPTINDASVLPPYQLVNTSAIYVGSWKSGQRSGYGLQYWPQGAFYEGYWKNDKGNGQGRLIHSDGDMYEGEWQDDKAHGKGEYFHTDGAYYQGDWYQDLQHGSGKEIWPDGASYEGEFYSGKKQGKGKFTFADGGVYEGEFHENNMHGEGTYIWTDGRIYKGSWLQGKMNGFGEFTWPDGKRYKGTQISIQGYYSNGRKEGFGELYWVDGKYYKGNWKQGNMHGAGTYKDKDGEQTGEWFEGKLQ